MVWILVYNYRKWILLGFGPKARIHTPLTMMAPGVVRGWNLTHFFAMKTAFLSYAPFVTLQEHGLLFRSHSGTIVRIADLNAKNYR